MTLIELLAYQEYTSPVETSSIQLSNLSKYDYVLAIVGNWAGTRRSRAEWSENFWLNQGVEIGYSIYNATSSCMTRTYKIPITGDSMTLTGTHIFYYQVFGVSGYDIDLITSLTAENEPENLITSFLLVNLSKYSDILLVNDVQYGSSQPESTMRTEDYINEGSEIGYSGGRTTPSHFSVTTKVPVSGSSITLTGRIYYYQVFGLYVNHIKSTGSTEAIRDWLNASLYNKEEIDNLFIQNNQSGLIPYDLTVEGYEPEQMVKLVGQTSGKVYNLCLAALMGGLMINFSTEEQKTGMKWIDGKDVYQKTIVSDTLPASLTTLITGVDELVASFGTQLYSTTNVWYDFPFTDNNGPRTEVDITNHNLRVRYNSANSITKVRWTFLYTKV